MCPESLKKHLKALESIKGKEFDYEAIKVEIADWLSENDPSHKQSMKSLEDPNAGKNAELDVDVWDFDPDTLDDQQLRALVKNKFEKKPKGAGKNSGGPGKGPADSSGKTCYDCGEVGHVGADCPQRKARVAAGGPERLPRDDSKGGKSRK